MPPITKLCPTTNQQFTITEEDQLLLQKLSPTINKKKYPLPLPTLSPEARLQRRLSFRNESSLHKRTCSLTGDQIIATYGPNTTFPVYKNEAWFSDKWDPRDYGRPYDFNRPFFEQFAELRQQVPHCATTVQNNINCDYCNIVGNSKDCYLCYGSIECQECLYGSPFKSTKCVDSLVLRNSELCLECTDSNRLYNCYICQNCENSSNLKICFDVKNSKDCFACSGLNQKQYCIFNKQYSKEEYEQILTKIDLTNEHQFQEIKSRFEQLKLKTPRRYYIGTNNENVTGNYIYSSKNCHHAYNVESCQDTRHTYQMLQVKDCMDTDHGEYGELNYEVMAFFENVSNTIFSYLCWTNCSNLIYCAFCTPSVHNCFGSYALRRSSYCILNKQYTKQEYEDLLPRVISHMQETGEWGQFFPAPLSEYPYNENIAQELFPLTKQEAQSKGLNWQEEPPLEKVEESDNIKTCEITQKPFRIIKEEIQIYHHFQAPLPKRSPKQRHLDRMSLRNPMKLWPRTCPQTNQNFLTTYSPTRPEIIFSEEAYQSITI